MSWYTSRNYLRILLVTNDVFKFAQVNSLKFHAYKAVFMRKLPQNHSGLDTIIKV